MGGGRPKLYTPCLPPSFAVFIYPPTTPRKCYASLCEGSEFSRYPTPYPQSIQASESTIRPRRSSLQDGRYTKRERGPNLRAPRRYLSDLKSPWKDARVQRHICETPHVHFHDRHDHSRQRSISNVHAVTPPSQVSSAIGLITRVAPRAEANTQPAFPCLK
ncbi:hypothetical protein BV22DRAFT_920827 [Leucogyrophana mollusca]|uniref:Uncharacterized protein n=1 Tax=Leucogyrophana mollusca TaxID=85980 RepID=A0ACB8AYS5_9AGAM|nr:hypothetical protein BV22DRAFT_920827 [Leucogyrophana mollusca]